MKANSKAAATDPIAIIDNDADTIAGSQPDLSEKCNEAISRIRKRRAAEHARAKNGAPLAPAPAAAEMQEGGGASSGRNGGVTPTPENRTHRSNISPAQPAGSSRMTRGMKQVRAALGDGSAKGKERDAFEVMLAGSKASQAREGCGAAKVTAEELKSKPNAILKRTSKEPNNANIKKRVAKLDGMTVFSALQLNLPGGVGVHGGVYTASDMKYDIESGYLIMQVEGKTEPTDSEGNDGDAGESGECVAHSPRQHKRRAPVKVKVEPGTGEGNKKGETKNKKVRLNLNSRKSKERQKRKRDKNDWYVLLVLFLVLHPTNHGRQTKRVIQTGAVLSSPPLFEVQAAQCEATVCAIGFLLRVCVCVDCAGHALMVDAPRCELASAGEDRDKFSCNKKGVGHDMQCKVIAQQPHSAPMVARHQAESRIRHQHVLNTNYVFTLFLYICIYSSIIYL